MPGCCRARCSLNDDCLLRVAGVGNGSDLRPDDGVGSAGRDGIVLLRGSLCGFFATCTAPTHFVSNCFRRVDAGLITGLMDSI